jgi:membrane fusion protein (multidrug efflux system)
LKARRAEVELGQRADGYIEVLSGLDLNDKVITEGIIRVREGSDLRLQERSMLSPQGALAERSRGGGGAASTAAN